MPVLAAPRTQRGHLLYVLDEPTTGLHPSDVEKLVAQLHGLVDAGNTVVVVEHDMHVIAGSDWVIDIGPGAGEEGGRVVAAGPPATVARAAKSRTAPYLGAGAGVREASDDVSLIPDRPTNGYHAEQQRSRDRPHLCSSAVDAPQANRARRGTQSDVYRVGGLWLRGRMTPSLGASHPCPEPA